MDFLQVKASVMFSFYRAVESLLFGLLVYEIFEPLAIHFQHFLREDRRYVNTPYIKHTLAVCFPLEVMKE